MSKSIYRTCIILRWDIFMEPHKTKNIIVSKDFQISIININDGMEDFEDK